MLRSFRMPALALGLFLVLPAVASANGYLVTSCTDPLGQPNAAVGWVPFSTPGGVTANTCAGANGSLQARLPDPKPPSNATANWRFDAPPGTSIVRVTARRTTAGLAGPAPQLNDISYQMTGSNGQPLEECLVKVTSAPCNDLTGSIDRQGLSSTFVMFRVLCTEAGGTCNRALSVEATHMWVTLEDPAAPAVANVRVLDDGDTSGVLRVDFDAADVGGGLYRTIVKVDGKIAQASPLGPIPCADVNPSDTDPYQFNVPVPCPPLVKGTAAAIDVRKLKPGPHGVEVAVEDAAGNQTTVFGPVEFPKANIVTGSAVERAEALTGRLRMWFVKAKSSDRRRYTSTFGNRVVTRGVLRTRKGRGIVGARIDVYHIRSDGRRRLVKTGLKSRAKGALTLILPNNVDTRTLEFAYRAVRPGPITSRQRLRLTVRTRSGRVYHRNGKS